MFLAADRPSEPVESVQQLVDYFAAAAKPRAEWRVGTEHEMIGVYAADGSAPPYEGGRGIAAIFERFAAAGWRPVHEGETVIALMCAGGQMTFEPGGQLEHAVRPLDHTDELVAAVERNVAIVADVSSRLGIAWLSIGFRPFGRLEDVPWMPKRRYEVMRSYLPTRAPLPHEMMKRTATVQVNLDYADAEDALEKMRCMMSVTSLMTAIYANSPIVDGALTDYQSYRARVWLDTDPDRCGLLPFVFEDGDPFRGYAEWALDVPMFFVYRGGDYRPAGGMTFRRFMREGFGGERATLDDWALHLSTLFPEARLKTYLEVRGCDAGSFEMNAALGALSRGLFYDADARRAAIELTAGLSFAERLALLRAVPQSGLATPVGATGRTAGDLARDLCAIAEDGLGRLDATEIPHLAPVRAIVESRRTQADQAADAYRAAAGSPAALIRELAYPGLG
ncbi:MAG TPA: glutamate-cysteine ligase family protein, partial [Kofleriaceae bacterium]|nr:glutamate-cysteine ligase family protein [Kofleriaceae bacterium]